MQPFVNQISSFKDDKDKLNGVVYKDRISWVAYNPETGRLYHNELKNTLPSHLHISPLYQPSDEKEIEYCANMAEWWSALQEQADSTRVQVATRKAREHRLIGEMEVDVFFDATVEVRCLFPFSLVRRCPGVLR